MKKRIFLVAGMIAFTAYLTSCLDEENETFVPSITETSTSGQYFKGDSIPPEENDSTQLPPDTGGETGQNPVRP